MIDIEHYLNQRKFSRCLDKKRLLKSMNRFYDNRRKIEIREQGKGMSSICTMLYWIQRIEKGDFDYLQKRKR